VVPPPALQSSLILQLAELIDNCHTAIQNGIEMAAKWPKATSRERASHAAKFDGEAAAVLETHFHTTFQLNGHVASTLGQESEKMTVSQAKTLKPVCRLPRQL